MKPWVGVVVVLVAALGSVLAWGWQHLHAKDRPQEGDTAAVQFPVKPKDTLPPKIVVSENGKWDFGTMDQEEDGKHVFEISNDGPGVLSLKFAEKTCGCTGLTIEDVVWTKDEKTPPSRPIQVPPGGKTHLEFAWNTEFRTTLRTTARLVTDDPAQPVVEFTVDGQVTPSVELSQRQISVAQMRGSEGTALTVDVFSRSLENLEITQIEASHELVTATWEPLSQDRLDLVSAKSGGRATVRIAPGLPLGPFRTTLTVHTNSERRPKLTVDIAAKVSGDVVLTPFEELDFKTVKVTESRLLKLFIKVRGEAPVQVTLARVAPEFLKAELVGGRKNFYHLDVQVPVGAPGGPFRGVIELETDHPTAKVVRIPVRGDVSQ